MTIKHNTVNSFGQGVTWLKQGWQLFKQQPITWGVMALLVTIASVIGATFTVGQFIVSLLTPVLIGGIALTMDKVVHGETAQLEGLFAGFKHKPTLVQLLLIGTIGMAITGLNTLAAYMPAIKGLSQLLALVWLLALVFAIPLVAIQQQPAVAALKSSLWVSVVHLVSIVPFVFMAVLLTVAAAIPAGLGLLVLLPVLYCSIFCAFTMIYPQSIRTSPPHTSIENTREAPPQVMAALNTAAATVAAPASRQEPIEAIDVGLPKNITINYYDDYVHIARRWLSPGPVFSAALSVTATLGGYYFVSGQTASFDTDAEQWFLLLLPWLTGLFVLFGSYYLAAQCLNRTNIYASAATVEIKHQPLPWFGQKRLEATNIKQLFVRQRLTSSENRTHISYDIEVIPHSGATSTLLRNLKSNQQALFIEQELERFLKIENMRVPGDYS